MKSSFVGIVGSVMEIKWCLRVLYGSTVMFGYFLCAVINRKGVVLQVNKAPPLLQNMTKTTAKGLQVIGQTDYQGHEMLAPCRFQ